MITTIPRSLVNTLQFYTVLFILYIFRKYCNHNHDTIFIFLFYSFYFSQRFSGNYEKPMIKTDDGILLK